MRLLLEVEHLTCCSIHTHATHSFHSILLFLLCYCKTAWGAWRTNKVLGIKLNWISPKLPTLSHLPKQGEERIASCSSSGFQGRTFGSVWTFLRTRFKKFYCQFCYFVPDMQRMETTSLWLEMYFLPRKQHPATLLESQINSQFWVESESTGCKISI